MIHEWILVYFMQSMNQSTLILTLIYNAARAFTISMLHLHLQLHLLL